MLERSKFYDSLAESRLRSKFGSEVTFGVPSYLKIIIRGLQQTPSDKKYHQPRGCCAKLTGGCCTFSLARICASLQLLLLFSVVLLLLFVCFSGVGGLVSELDCSCWCLISTPAFTLHPLLCILPVETIILQWEPCFSSWFSTQLSLSFYCSLGS